MREIKFRAWDADSKKYWNIENWHVEDEYVDLIEPNDSNANPNAKRTWKRESDVIIEQSTGLKDANGKEIYEGDVVHVVTEDGYERTGKVIFEKGCYRVDNGMDKYPVSRIGFKRDTLEILGSVHVNPELIDFYNMKQP